MRLLCLSLRMCLLCPGLLCKGMGSLWIQLEVETSLQQLAARRKSIGVTFADWSAPQGSLDSPHRVQSNEVPLNLTRPRSSSKSAQMAVWECRFKHWHYAVWIRSMWCAKTVMCATELWTLLREQLRGCAGWQPHALPCATHGRADGRRRGP